MQALPVQVDNQKEAARKWPTRLQRGNAGPIQIKA
jgi:hypothetical protein